MQPKQLWNVSYQHSFLMESEFLCTCGSSCTACLYLTCSPTRFLMYLHGTLSVPLPTTHGTQSVPDVCPILFANQSLVDTPLAVVVSLFFFQSIVLPFQNSTGCIRGSRTLGSKCLVMTSAMLTSPGM